MLENFNAAIAFIEANLDAEPDMSEVARIAGTSADSFARIFSYLSGMSLSEYVRCRRLTRAAEDLRGTGLRILDIAVQYGYQSTEAFARAFVRQHGISPGNYRKNGGTIRAYPPATFQIIIRGAREMELKIIEMPRLEVYGVSQQYDGEDYRNREELRHKMWDEAEDDVPGKLCEAKWNQPGSKAMDGLWYGIWQDGRYMIAREKANLPHPEQWEKATIPAGTYACAKSAPGTLAWEELPKLFQELAECWLPTSGYCRRGGDDLLIELEHLWTDKEERREKRFYEVLIPVERK